MCPCLKVWARALSCGFDLSWLLNHIQVLLDVRALALGAKALKMLFQHTKEQKNRSICYLSISIVVYQCYLFFYSFFLSPLKPFPSHSHTSLFSFSQISMSIVALLATKSMTPQRSALPLTIFESASRLAPPPNCTKSGLKINQIHDNESHQDQPHH